jgi:hypothetical protein
MNIRLITVPLISCLLVAACGKPWTKPGATAEQVNADIKVCEQLAVEQYPVAMSSNDTSNRKEYETRCTSHGNQTNCNTRSRDTGGSYQYDRNEEKRRKAVSECLESRGYKR